MSDEIFTFEDTMSMEGVAYSFSLGTNEETNEPFYKYKVTDGDMIGLIVTFENLKLVGEMVNGEFVAAEDANGSSILNYDTAFIQQPDSYKLYEDFKESYNSDSEIKTKVDWTCAFILADMLQATHKKKVEDGQDGANNSGKPRD